MKPHGFLFKSGNMPPSLPEELLVLIFEHLAFPNVHAFADISEADGIPGPDDDDIEYKAYCDDIREGIKTLHRICLASKNLHRLAWPILYRAFTNREPFDPSVDPSNFLRTICLKPEYGLALRSLSIGDWNPIEAMDAMDLFELLQGDATVVALFQWRAKGFWFGDDLLMGENISLDTMDTAIGTLCRTLNMGLLDGHMSLLLLMCPNIRELDISPPLDFGTSTFAKLLNIATSPAFQNKSLPNPLPDPEEEESDYIVSQMFAASWPERNLQKPRVLQHLRSLKIRSPGPTGLALDFFKNLISLPSLQQLQVCNLWGGYRGSIAALRPVAQCPQLNSLMLPDCRLSSNEVAAIIRCCSGLTSLTVTWDSLYEMTSDSRDEKWCLKFGDIGEAIATHTPLLEHLTLDSTDGWLNFGAQPKRPYILGSSLADIPRLTRLTIDDHVVYGSEYGRFGFTLGETIPKSVVWLRLWETRNCETVEDPTLLIDEYLQYQVDDLNAFLQDDNFARLCRVDVGWDCLDMPTLKNHGWTNETVRLKNAEYGWLRGRVLINKARLKAMEAEHTCGWQDIVRD